MQILNLNEIFQNQNFKSRYYNFSLNQLKYKFEMQKQLTKEQLEEYNKIKENQLTAAQQQTATLCLQYFLAYKESVNVPSDKISLAFRCAFFMAEKSQITVNMKGQKVRAISFSLNKLVKDHKLDDTMFMLKQMTRKIKFIDEETSTYLNNIVKQISFLITLHSKFEKTFSQKLQLKEKQRIPEGLNYCKSFTSFAWLLFIISKNQILEGSLQLLPNTCMVAHIISMMLILSWDYIKPQALMRADRRLNENTTKKDYKKLIKQKILQIFCIKDLQQYQKVAQQFQNLFKNMIDNNLFKMNEQKMDFLSPEYIMNNYRKLDKYYETKLNMQHLDERIFFKQRPLNLTPSKFTPFARQGYVNKFQKPQIGNKLGSQKPSKEQTFNSHRVLNYEAIQKQIQSKTIPIHDIKLPKNIIQSPSMVKVPLVMATPITTGMEMYNYINQKKKRIKQNYSTQRANDKSIMALIEKIFRIQQGDNDKINKETKQSMVIALYKIFSHQYLAANTYEKETPQLMKAFLGLSLELVFFVSNITLSFERIQEQLQLQPFETWKAIDFFLKSDKSIPYPIKLHFLDLQVNFISFKIWQNYDMVRKLANFGNKSPKQMTEVEINFIQKLFKRTVHQVAFQITRLTTLLDIDESISEKIFDAMKQILTNYSQLLYRRHLDQLIICCIYANCKGVMNYNIMFNNIKQCYIASNPNLSSIIENIITNVYMGEEEPSKDVIGFYNKIFIQNEKLKEFIVNSRANGPLNGVNMNTINKNSKKNTLLMSPLKAIIPKQINFKSKNLVTNPNNAKIKGKNNNMTPQTQLLYAYNQSPILKYEVNTFKGPLKSKKVLTFQQQQQKTGNKSYEQEFGVPTPRVTQTAVTNPHSTSTTNNYQSTNDFINRKYANSNTNIRKVTTPTHQHQGSTNQALMHAGTHGNVHNYGHQNQQMHVPLQNITKQNQNPPMSSNSHRVLFQEKKQSVYTQGVSHIDETKYKNKNYQFSAFRRQ